MEKGEETSVRCLLLFRHFRHTLNFNTSPSTVQPLTKQQAEEPAPEEAPATVEEVSTESASPPEEEKAIEEAPAVEDKEEAPPAETEPESVVSDIRNMLGYPNRWEIILIISRLRRRPLRKVLVLRRRRNPLLKQN